MPSGSNHAVRFDHCGACTMPAFIERVDVPRADQIPPSATEGTLVSIFRGIRGWGWKPIRQTGQASARRASHASYLLLAFAGLLVVLCLSASAATDSTPAVKSPQPHTTRNAVENVLQHARQLATRLHSEADPARLQPLVVQLGALEQRVSALPTVENDTLDELRELESQAHSLARQIAFCNPRLDFDKLLFIKRHDAAGVYHMCDQYYGCNAKPGGGLFVLEHPLSDHPHVVNLLEDSVVQNGRLKGQQARRGIVPVARAVVRRPDDPVRLQRGQGLGEISGERGLRVEARIQLPHFQVQCRRQQPGAVDRRAVGRFRSLLPAQRPDRVHLRAARRLFALRASLPGLHHAQHGSRRQRHHSAEPP